MIDNDLASGEKGGCRFRLGKSGDGYTVTTEPTAGTSVSHTFYSDQTLGIHHHTGLEAAGPNDPLVGDKP